MLKAIAPTLTATKRRMRCGPTIATNSRVTTAVAFAACLVVVADVWAELRAAKARDGRRLAGANSRSIMFRRDSVVVEACGLAAGVAGVLAQAAAATVAASDGATAVAIPAPAVTHAARRWVADMA